MADLASRVRVLACAHFGYTELRAAVAAAERGGRLPGSAFATAKAWLERVWASTSPIVVDLAAARLAGDLAETHRLRGYDALHLAALQKLGTPSRINSIACWDGELRLAAFALGYRLFPA
ncbi:MAG TPA: type II toxin-antitoxin system VapC family toxin [Candidatus Dormibacteraeota bacterium]|jgi:predicted nucleic acid-binding protein|nr:type II toxin-antitoxin system VapC family toxin [Candidatus Dormibacteraeota bacterium]